MIRLTNLRLPLEYTDQDLRRLSAKRLHVPPAQITAIRLVRRSVDARHKPDVCFIASLDVALQVEEAAVVRRCHSDKVQLLAHTPYILPSCAKPPAVRPLVVGAGPAGLFAALVLARAGLCPRLIERGQPVEQRLQDVERFWQTGRLDTASNVQFGEGGAGTFSDGKLHTGIRDPRISFVFDELVRAGAPESILWQAQPHIGTDKLADTVRGLRRAIEQAGGTLSYATQLTGLAVQQGHVRAVQVRTPQSEEEWPATHVILAIGHSARDTVESLFRQGVPMQAKPFAVGVRIEHPRVQIDRSQYGAAAGHPALGAAAYKLSCRPTGCRGVYTFCMCPGGVVVAAASESGGVAVNGMSTYARDGVNSNSALLVGVGPGDYGEEHPLAGIGFQRHLEREAFALAGGGYRAPAQLVGDFLAGRPSTQVGEVIPSYRPGVTFTDLRQCLPTYVATSLADALPLLGRRLMGFDRPDAVLTGVESRSSSPVRILRDDKARSPVSGLYPCGEGAGYAGGITSAAADGVFCAEQVIAAL